MPLTELRFNAGVNRENTSLSNRGRWYSCDKVRFRFGEPEKIGGWASYTTNTYYGQCRFLFNWITLAGNDYMAVGTSQKFYIEWGQALYDITPIRQTFTPLTNPFGVTLGSNIVQLNINTNGAVIGDFVIVSGVTGGPYNGLTAAQLNGEFQITAVDSSGNWVQYGVSGTASGTNAATGGTGITAAFEINIGLDVEVAGTGWGAGPWSRGTWGSAAAIGVTTSLRLWSGDKFGQNLIFNIFGGSIFYYDVTTFPARAVYLSAVATDPNAPTLAACVCVTSARHVMVFGTQPVGSVNVDPMYVRWSNQEDITSSTAWTATLTNQAGGQRLTDGAYIVGVKQTQQQILVWTNSALYAFTFVGTPFIYALQQVGTNISTAGINAAAVVGGTTVFWMGNNKFYMYNGVVNTLPCDVRAYVFDNMNTGQTEQIFAFTVERFNEVWWLYPSGTSTVNNSYVAYNYVDNVWTYGSISRTAWLDTPLRPNPVAAGNNTLYYQEYGNDAAEMSGTSAFTAYIESADIDILEGEKFAFIRRLVPDVTFIGSANSSPQCNITIYVRRMSGVNYDTNALTPITETAVVPVEQFTSDAWIRLRGRQFKFRIDSNTLGTQWHLGTCLMHVQPDGKR
jgi:hypothetical protein